MKKPVLKMNKKNSEESIRMTAELFMNYSTEAYLEWFRTEGHALFQEWFNKKVEERKESVIL